MTAAVYDFEINQGSTFRKQIIWKDGDTGSPINLTGYSVRLQARRSYYDDEVLIDMSSTNGAIQIVPAEGKFVLQLTAAQTALYEDWTKAKYSVRVTSSGGVVTKLLEGEITLVKDIIRD